MVWTESGTDRGRWMTSGQCKMDINRHWTGECTHTLRKKKRTSLI